MRQFFRPAQAPEWLGDVLNSTRGALSDEWPTPLRLSPFEAYAVPPAADWPGGMIYITDETGGAVPAFSDGTKWRRVTDRAVVSFTPVALFAGGGLGAAYDPTDLSTLFQLSSGTTAVTAHGDPIGYMGDTSGNANHALQSSASNRPTLSIVSSVKSLGVASASTQNLVIPAAMLSGWTSGTIVFAAKRAADPPGAGADGPVIGGAGTSGSSNHYPYTDGVVYSDFLSTVRKTAGDPGDMAAWHTGDFRSAANSWIAAFNSTDYHTTGTNTVGAGVAPIIGQIFDGLIGRMIIINRVLSGADLTKARAWVAAGYA